MTKEAQQKTLTKANKVVARYKQFKQDLIVTDQDDHPSLLSADEMTDRQCWRSVIGLKNGLELYSTTQAIHLQS
jgi:hypothetical protein